MMETYVLVTAIVCALGGISWNKSDAVNLLVKCGLLALGGWGFYILLHAEWAATVGGVQ